MVPGPTVSLPPRQLFEIPDASSARILCTAGCLWLTIDHDPRDVVLHPGDSFEGKGARRALLYALEPSAFVLTATCPTGARRGNAPIVWGTPRAAGAR